jgi:hypothetical protein
MDGASDSPDRRAPRRAEAAEAFDTRWPSLVDADRAPPFTWEALERTLVELAPSDLQAELVRGLVARVRANAHRKPAEMVLREVLKTAALLLDDPPRQADNDIAEIFPQK